MTWERQLLELFEELEQRAQGFALASRDSEVADLGRGLYAEVTLLDRIHASIGARLQVVVVGLGALRGRLARAGADWLLLVDESVVPQEWVLSTKHVTGLRGLSPRALPESARPVTAGLRLTSVLRGLSESPHAVTVVQSDGRQRATPMLRVGGDFVEVSGESRGTDVLPLISIAAVRRG